MKLPDKIPQSQTGQMPEERNPFAAPKSPSEATVKPSGCYSALKLISAACLGIVIGSYISAELLYYHYPDATRTTSEVLSNTIAATLSSPISMSFGVFPTLGFYGDHGWLVLPGFIAAALGSIQFWRVRSWPYLLATSAGFALWAHNNYLSLQALMSV